MRSPNYVQLLRRLMYSFYTPSIVSCDCGWAEHVVVRCIIHVVSLSSFSACGISLYRGLTTEQGIRLQALSPCRVDNTDFAILQEGGIGKRCQRRASLVLVLFFKHMGRCFPMCEPPRLVQRVDIIIIIIILILLFCRKEERRC